MSAYAPNRVTLTDLSLHFAGYVFSLAFGLQLGIIGDFLGHFPGLVLHFVKRSFCLVHNVRFYKVPP